MLAAGAAALFATAAPAGEAPRIAVEAGGAEFAEGEVLIRLRPGTSPGSAAMLAAELGAEGGRPFRLLSEARQRPCLLLRSPRRSTAELLASLRGRPEVEAASPNYRRRLQRLPNDPAYSRQWGLAKIRAPEAWERSVGAGDVVLAVLDTGVDYRHGDLAANMWRNPGEIEGNGVDDDGNGFRDDVYGYDFAATASGGNDADPMDIDNHGTHVAGIMAAVGDNGSGVCGVNWRARIMALKGFRPDLHIYDSDCIEAIEYAVMMKRERGVNLVAINASFGGGGSDPLQQDAIALAGDEGIAFVCAAGNDGSDNDATPFYPAGYDLANVVSVAASDGDDGLASFSNFGRSSVDIAAPGQAIYSTVPRGSGLETWLKSGDDVLDVTPMEFSGRTGSAGLNRKIVDCGLGRNAGEFPAAVGGNIALIERGVTTFQEKALNAQAAGAAGVVIYNNVAGGFDGTLGSAGGWVPVVSMSREDGLLLKSRGVHSVNLTVRPGDYGYLSGTSMAAPHVCGALGLLAAQHPGDALAKQIGRLYSGADRIAALDGKMVYGARLNLARSLAQTLVLTMTVARRKAQSWMVVKDYAEVGFAVEKEPGSAISGETYTVYRKIPGNSFEKVEEIAAAELTDNAFIYRDKYLESGTSYTYVVEARSAQGEVLALSNEATI
jgi:subtilisin family serine protease